MNLCTIIVMKLIGYIGISEFEQGVLEISGLVHPEYRTENFTNCII